MKKRSLSVSYLLFYILFWPDTYRIVFGIVGAVLLAPLMLDPSASVANSAMVHTMLAVIGYAATARPARSIASFLQKKVLKGHHK